MTSTICLLAWIAVLVTVPFLLIDRLLESPADRARRLRRRGWSQQRIADYLDVSRTTVRRLLA
jgi:hypothetical protein